jgi:hypothetical protein
MNYQMGKFSKEMQQNNAAEYTHISTYTLEGNYDLQFSQFRNFS